MREGQHTRTQEATFTPSEDGPLRLDGVNLKYAEQLVRRLTLHQPLLPSYVRPPPLPATTPDSISSLLNDPLMFAELLPPSIDPAWRAHESPERSSKSPNPVRQSGVPPLRAARKRTQIIALLHVIVPILSQPTCRRVFEFCCGCGHLGLLVAALFPDISVTLVDTRSVPLQIAKRRADAANLSNVDFIETRVENLSDDITFDVALGLHACGAASDAILTQAAKRRATVVLAPCCVGAVHNATGALHPVIARSRAFGSMLSSDEYGHLARAADFGEAALKRDNWRFVAKSLIEYDRLLSLSDDGYSTVHLVKMRPVDCTPKNDILVAWCNNSSLDTPNASPGVVWSPDHLANGLLTDFLDASVLNGLGLAEVQTVEATLRQHVCDPASTGVYSSPRGCGKRARKVIHAVADSLGLFHESVGRGADRYVIVRRNEYWPLFFDHYVGIGGPHIDELGDQLSRFVPSKFVERRRFVRGAPYHITIIAPKEVSLLPSRHKRDLESCVADIYSELKGTTFSVIGIGRVRKEVGVHRTTDIQTEASRKAQGVDENVEPEETYFGLVKWPEVQAVRHRLGLPSSALHITLGFKNRDVYNVPKDVSTLIRLCGHTCSPWMMTT